MTKTFLAAAAALCAAAALPAQAAGETALSALPACSASFFKAVAQDKNIPEKYKIHEGDMAYLKVEKLPLEVVQFDKPFEENGLTVTGYIFNDEIIRYFGVPDMHTHFWGFLIKEPWKKVVDAFNLDWEAVDMNHMSAHANRMMRMNGQKEGWKPYHRDPSYTMPEFGQMERAFHVAPYNDQTMVFCSMQSAGAPEEAIIREVRPDLLYGEKHENIPVREEKTEGEQSNAAAKK